MWTRCTSPIKLGLMSTSSTTNVKKECKSIALSFLYSIYLTETSHPKSNWPQSNTQTNEGRKFVSHMSQGKRINFVLVSQGKCKTFWRKNKWCRLLFLNLLWGFFSWFLFAFYLFTFISGPVICSRTVYSWKSTFLIRLSRFYSTGKSYFVHFDWDKSILVGPMVGWVYKLAYKVKFKVRVVTKYCFCLAMNFIVFVSSVSRFIWNVKRSYQE